MFCTSFMNYELKKVVFEYKFIFTGKEFRIYKGGMKLEKYIN